LTVLRHINCDRYVLEVTHETTCPWLSVVGEAVAEEPGTGSKIIHRAAIPPE
jgi:hypothetical protein